MQPVMLRAYVNTFISRYSKAIPSQFAMKLLLTATLFVSQHYLLAQDVIIRSAEDNSTIPGAKLILQPINGDELLKYTSDAEGRIHVASSHLGQKRYIYTVSAFGFRKTTDTFRISGKNAIDIHLVPLMQDYDEVVITAQYKAQKVDQSVHQIRIIDEEQIKRMAAQNLKDALSNSMNIRLGEDNILGSRMQLQGIGGQNVKILVDGVPLTGRLDGNIDISQIPMENVARIEVIEGPLSVQYGTDALAGTINIITKKSNASRWSIQSTNYYESNGKYNNTGQLRWGKKKHQFAINGGRYFFDGWNPEDPNFFYDRSPIADSSRVKNWNPKEQFFGNFNYRYHHKRFRLNYSSANFKEQVINRGAPRPPYEQTAFDDYYHTTRLNQRIQTRFDISDHSNLNIIAAYNGFLRRKNTYLRDLTTIEDQLSPNVSDQDTSQFHTFLSRGNWVYAKDSSKIQFSLGYDINHDIAVGKRIASGRQSITDIALFGSLEYTPFERLTLRPGLRAAYNSDYPAPLVPSFNLKLRMLDKKGHKLDFRGSYARGFRSPSIKELHFYFVDINHNIQGNEELTAETSHNANISLTYIMPINKMQCRSNLRAFYNDISNKITLAQQNQTLFSYFNLDVFKTTGVQFQSGLQKKNLNMQVGLGYVGRYNQFSVDESMASQFLFSPEGQVSLQAGLFQTGVNVNLFYKYTGELPNVIQNEDGSIEQNVMEDYHMLDATVSKSFFKERVQLSAGVKNALNVRSIAGTSVSGGAHSSGTGMIQVGTGRTYFMRLILEFKSKRK